MAVPLEDLHVLDYTQGLAGPSSAMLFGDLGADVIKVEPPDRMSRGDTDFNFGYLACNRNKRSIMVDLTRPKGRELFERLLRWADVMVINMRVNARQRRHITYEDVVAINPRLIYASLTAFGEEGPDADLPGLDIVCQARSGDIAARAALAGAKPLGTRLLHFDMSTAIVIFSAVMVALRQRERTGRGQKVGINILQTALALEAQQMMQVPGREDPISYGGFQPGLASSALFECMDGRYILIYSLNAHWDSFCHALGLDHLITDPKFDTPAKRDHEADALREILGQRFATKPVAEWETILKGADQVGSMVKELHEVPQDPQVIANKMIIEFEQPGVGMVKAVNVPFRMTDTQGEHPVRRPVPTRGEHTNEVLLELGYKPDEIKALQQEGAIGKR